VRHRSHEEQLRARLQGAEAELDERGARLTAAENALAAMGQRLHDFASQSLRQEERIGELTGRAKSIAAELELALERIAGFEHERGLQRIERDELLAQTQRLRALPAAAALAIPAADIGNPTAVEPVTVSRAELSDRNERIHELECQLRQSRSRARELEQDLHTWKFRIAPVALHQRLKHDKARRSAPTPGTRPELCRIRGIGRRLAKKLGAEGITQVEQLAAMSPDELAGIAVRLGLAASRPRRDHWAEQARRICQARPAAPARRPDVA
jgi:predicted flap endonuclease-1-like 5' DNA nuclease